MKTEFNLKDRVWVIWSRMPKEITITKIFTEDGKVYYSDHTNYNYEEHEIGKTKEDLKRKVFQD